MMYYTSEARQSAINSIKNCISKIGAIPGNVLSFGDASDATKYLNLLIDQIEKEDKKATDGRNQFYGTCFDYKQFIE